MELVVGVEDVVHRIEDNTDQAWLGLQYTANSGLWDLFQPYARAMVGLGDGDDYLLAAGLSFEWMPFESSPDLSIRLQTGPGYTNVGPPHTGSHLNWTSDISVHYNWMFLGYSHTSNGGVYSPNSGLDMVLIGITLP
jgi:hypothetical protein